MTRDRGVGEDRGVSGRIRGGRSIQALEGSHITFPHALCPPHPKTPPDPTATISKPPSQKPEEAAPKASTPVAREAKLVPEVPSSAASPALEMAIPTHMTPLHLQLGASRGSISARLRVKQEAVNLTCHYLCTCAQGPFRGEVCVSLLCQNLPQFGSP